MSGRAPKSARASKTVIVGFRVFRALDQVFLLICVFSANAVFEAIWCILLTRSTSFKLSKYILSLAFFALICNRIYTITHWRATYITHANMANN
nr:MAG TPA: hypothetical protein [Caudoviricetes sp.]